MNTKRIEVDVMNDECACPNCGEEWWFDTTDIALECDCGIWLIVKTRSLASTK